MAIWQTSFRKTKLPLQEQYCCVCFRYVYYANCRLCIEIQVSPQFLLYIAQYEYRQTLARTLFSVCFAVRLYCLTFPTRQHATLQSGPLIQGLVSPLQIAISLSVHLNNIINDLQDE